MEEMFRLQQYEPLWEDWHVDKLLHEGSMSNVYQVKSEKSTGVIKVISVPKLQPEGRLNGQGENEKYETMNVFFKEVVESLVEEIERVGVLNYIPNVLGYRKWQVFQRKEDVGYDLILLMDKEESLKDYLASHEEVTNVEIVRIVKEVAWILSKSHQEGIIHKNIKIDNIFVAENGESMLADFSLARKIESYQSRSQKREDSTYKAPEILSEYDCNEVTDVYALGIVLYLLLNEQRIPAELLNRNFKTEIPKPCRAGEELTEVVFRAISYRSKDRFSSADEFFHALSELREEELKLPKDYLLQEEERKREEERQKKEEAERLEEEERRKKEEAERLEEENRRKKAEEERLEKEREEMEAARKEEEKRKVEERRKQEEEELKERFRKEAEEIRIRAIEEKASKEREELGRMAKRQEYDLYEEFTLAGAAAELEKSVQDMKQVETEAKESIQNTKIDADGKVIYDRDAEPNKEFTDYSSEYDEKLLDEVFEEVNEIQHKEKQVAPKRKVKETALEFDTTSLIEQILDKDDEAPEFEIHSDATEYSGFFDFDKEAYQEKEKEVAYDKSLDTEPFEPEMKNFPKEPIKKSHVVIILVLIFLCSLFAYGWHQEEIRDKVKGWVDDISVYIEEQMEMNLGSEKVFKSDD